MKNILLTIVLLKIALFISSMAVVATETSGDYPQWLGGPERTGAVSGGPALADAWPKDGPPLLWRAALPNSTSPGGIVVSGNRVYLTIAYSVPLTGDKAGKFRIVSSVFCLDITKGAIIWQRELGDTAGGWLMPGGTPAVVDGRVYVIYGPIVAGSTGMQAQRTLTLEVCCVDAENGKLLWEEEQEATAGVLTMHGGPYTSPLVLDGVCVVQHTGVTAYDAITGKRLWRQIFVDGAHSSPSAWHTPGGTCVLCRSSIMPKAGDGIPIAERLDEKGQLLPLPQYGAAIYCLDLKTGKPRWAVVDSNSMWNAPTPVIIDDTLVDLAGFGENNAYSLGAGLPKHLWANMVTKMVAHYGPTPSVADGFIYTPSDVGLVCQKLGTGDITGTLPFAVNKSAIFANAIAADGKVIYALFTANSFKNITIVYLLQGGPNFRVLSKFSVPSLIDCTTPTVAGGLLFLRLDKGLACYDLRKLPAEK